jgi:carbamoyltransferase
MDARMSRGGTKILGLAASHNGAACLLRDGKLELAIQEERVTRKKRATLDPANFAALQYVLGDERPDLVALSPLHDANAAAAKLASHPTLGKVPCVILSHHRAHAAAALAQSGFDDATVLVIDGAGSRAEDLPDEERTGEGRETVSIYDGKLRPLHKRFAPPAEPKWREGMMPFTSLGVMYQSVALQIFGHWDAAGKVMALAPYGTPRRPVSDFLDGELNFFDVDVKGYQRWPDRADEYAALAAETQQALEFGVLEMAKLARRLGHSDRLCYAGGVALNSVANTRIIREAGFREVFIMPAAEDNGTAIGAACLAMEELPRFAIDEDATGRIYGNEPSDDTLEQAAELLAAGHSVGWFQGRSEFGPRALGQRSILLDPRIPDGKERLNRLKGREDFRPFAPAVLAEKAPEWFVESGVSPFMLQVWHFREEVRARVPAVVHVDGTGRVQTVAQHGPFRRLLQMFEARTGVPMLLNTSFNVAGEPIVETPEDARETFREAKLDALVLNDVILRP